MEEEGPINFKALRAKFQEEVLLAQNNSKRPTVAEKPKYVPPPGGHCSSVVSGLTAAPENKSPVLPQVIFRDGLRASGGKRPNSFPPHLQQNLPSSQIANGDSTAKQSLKERHMPLVLPTFPYKEQKMHPPAAEMNIQDSESVKGAFSQNKIKKKGLLLPFKSSKTSKVSAGNGEEPTYADLTTRPLSAPGELPSIKMHATQNGGSMVQGENSNVECPHSSPDAPITPPSSETSVDSDSRFISTLEKAKKKFSRRQMLMSTKTKSFPSPGSTSAGNVFPFATNTESVNADPPILPPICLPHMACISARPFFKGGNSLRKSPLAKNFGKDQVDPTSGKSPEPHSLSIPRRKSLPDSRLLGSLPTKPPRPPMVDLSLYYLPSPQSLLPALSQVQTDEPDVKLPSVSSVVLDAPKFSEFDNSEIKIGAGNPVDFASLELESLDFPSKDLPVPDFEVFESDLSACDYARPRESSIIQDVNIGSKDIILLDPASYPEPIYLPEFLEPPSVEEGSQSENVAAIVPLNSQTDEVYQGAAEVQSVLEESELSNHSELNSFQPHSSVYQQDSCYETCDNVYEVVEDINKVRLGQSSLKQKSGLKNPYAENNPRVDASLNKWQPNAWGSGLDHSNNAFIHIYSKERQSPNTADFKEQKKREKHRIEKEKKEQKEKEKKENEMRKKFKVTGDEDPLYHAKVVVASKVRKNDLPVKSGDTVSIIRTTSCPKGKWLARDVNYRYGYISVMNVELNIKEMLELGKKAQAAGRGCNHEGDTISMDSRSSSHPVLTSSFTDDSEEWGCEDETLSPTNESHSLPQQTSSVSEFSCSNVGAQHTFSDANPEDLHTQHEALQKLAIFFQHTRDEFIDEAEADGDTPTNAETPNFLRNVEEPPYEEQELDFNQLELLPPPPLYADTF